MGGRSSWRNCPRPRHRARTRRYGPSRSARRPQRQVVAQRHDHPLRRRSDRVLRRHPLGPDAAGGAGAAAGRVPGHGRPRAAHPAHVDQRHGGPPVGPARPAPLRRDLDPGAADFVVKPFSPVELAARIRAALRPREKPEPSRP